MRNFVPRDIEFENFDRSQTFFFRVASYATRKKQVWHGFFAPDSRSRGTKFLKKRYTSHKDYELQGSPSAEHPTKPTPQNPKKGADGERAAARLESITKMSCDGMRAQALHQNFGSVGKLW